MERFTLHNDAIKDLSGLQVASRSIWNPAVYRQIGDIIRRVRPAIVHCHNTFPMVSPAVYYAAGAAHVPVVQTLHNYRLICPAATLYRESHLCEECVGHFIPYSSVLHRCYRGNRLASLAVATMLTTHHALGTWGRKVQTYITPTHFMRNKLLEGGLPSARVSVKPNFLAMDPGQGEGEGGYVLFAGRLAEEKGLATLLRAWDELPDIPLRVVGDGPLRAFVQTRAGAMNNVSVEGFCDTDQVLELMKRAACVVVPSQWYEGFPMTVIEAMACGTPVVGSCLGSLREVLQSGITGEHFEAGNARDLARCVRRLMSDPLKLQQLRERARSHFEKNFMAKRNYELLRQIYESAIKAYPSRSV